MNKSMVSQDQEKGRANKQSDQNEIVEIFVQYEPLNAEERQRNDDIPLGLKNIGNSKP